MYENITFEMLLNRILGRIKSDMDKREGTVIHDATAPSALELQNLYIAIDAVLNETYADTASLPYLKKRAGERGIFQKMATNAILKAVFTPASVAIPIGSVFNLEQINYTVIEKIADGEYKMRCDTSGTIGNAQLGKMIPVTYINGLQTAELVEVLIPADDDEDVESLRQRYFNSLTSQAFGGNIADYKEKIKSLGGVGGVKITPVWNGGGTVKATIMDSTFGVPSSELLEKIKNAADPYPNEGLGYGFAPIGHVVTVEGVTPVTVNITTELTYASGWSWEAAGSVITGIVEDYFKEMSKDWEKSDNEGLIVRISQLESRILDCEGILDIANTTLNGSPSNLVLQKMEVPVRGTINGK